METAPLMLFVSGSEWVRSLEDLDPAIANDVVRRLAEVLRDRMPNVR